ncbi:MAG TPA: dienelactone hydrolase family protein [Casimicrobiaceae bacterium]|nr:dienelactone hydrolase family protein [Casimicrobiaceae bacterium]
MSARLLLLVFAFIAACANGTTLQRVRFDSVDKDASGAPVSLRGVLLVPQGPAPAGGFPALVALHGCGGMYSAIRGHEQELAQRLALRAKRYVKQGYVVLFPDSFGSRGMREVCTLPRGSPTITIAQRRLDALGALAWLARRDDVAHDRIVLIGWSHGGSTALQASNLGDAAVARFAGAVQGPAFFRAVIAFYPGCKVPLQNAARWKPAAPTRVYIGALDDWTAPEPCVAWGEAMRQHDGNDVQVKVYPGAHHGFDSPLGSVVHRTDVPNGVHPGQGVHVGAEPAAREAANADVDAFLRARMAKD